MLTTTYGVAGHAGSACWAKGGRAALETKETTHARPLYPPAGPQVGHRPDQAERGAGGLPARKIRTLRETVPVAPRGSLDYTALLCLGAVEERRTPANAEAAAHTELRQSAVTWAHGIKTKTGTDRGWRIARCGKMVPALGEVSGLGLFAMPCRDRACPNCQRARSKKLKHQLRRALRVRSRQDREALSRCYFVTLTVPKPARRDGWDADAVLREVMGHWSRLRGKCTQVDGQRWNTMMSLFAGGVRVFETTWSARGDKHGSHTVAYDGFHTHIHLLMEVRPGVDPNAAWCWLQTHWCEQTGASPHAQKFLCMDDRRAGELCKYMTKPLEDVATRRPIARELFAALQGKRLIHGFGRWKDFLQWTDDQEEDDAQPERIYLADDLTVGELLQLVTRQPLHEVTFRGFDRRQIPIPARIVWEGIEADPRTMPERWKDAKEGAPASRRKVPYLGPPVLEDDGTLAKPPDHCLGGWLFEPDRPEQTTETKERTI